MGHWKIHIRFKKDVRDGLDRLAASLGPRWMRDDGSVLDAELARVLIISELAPRHPPDVRAALALHTASVLRLSQAFSQMLADLRGVAGLPAAGKKSSEVYPRPLEGLPHESAKPAPRGRPREKVRDGELPDRWQILLTPDDWLRGQIAELAEARSLPSLPACALILLRSALVNQDRSVETIRAYVAAEVRVQNKIAKAIQAGQEAIIEALHTTT